MTQVAPPAGRRARNMQAKQDRIFAAAAALFAEAGFEAVTTQAISERADVAAGTLFRYTASKGELLMMVYNEELRRAIDSGRRAADAATDLPAAILAMVAPIVTAAQQHPENAVVYQRELLFGAASDGYRAEGLRMVAELQSAIAARLCAAAADGQDRDGVAESAMRAARSIFAVVHLLVAQPATGAHRGVNPHTELAAQTAQIVAGFPHHRNPSGNEDRAWTRPHRPLRWLHPR